MLQYKIPQNVGIEDKIVGPFSLRQLIILAVGTGISYILFAITSRLYELNIIEYILIAFPALFALAMAMLKINNVTFGKYILLTLEFAIKPKKRMWDHRGISALVAPDLTDRSVTAKKEEAVEKKGQKNVNLRDLSAMLDSGGFEHVEQVKHEDIDEVKDDDLITEAYFGHKKKESRTENMYWRTRDTQKKKLDLLAKMKSAKAPVTSKHVPVQPTPVTAAPAKKESVVEHLAGVIKEARQNNQTRKETVQANTASPTPMQTASEAATISEPNKKKRRQRRKQKPKAQPVRTDTQVDTTSKLKPVKLIKKDEQNEGETSFDDLSGSGEIEINLN